MQTIPDIWGKGKEWLDAAIGEWGLVAIVFLVALSSFGLGRLSALVDARPPVAIQTAEALQEPRGIYPGGQFVAARSGSAYYYPWCSGAARILSQNRVWFATEEAARAAGYAPAKNCKGLEK